MWCVLRQGTTHDFDGRISDGKTGSIWTEMSSGTLSTLKPPESIRHLHPPRITTCLLMVESEQGPGIKLLRLMKISVAVLMLPVCRK